MLEIYRNRNGEASLFISDKIFLIELNHITSKSNFIEFPTENEAQEYLQEHQYEKE